MTHDPKPPIPLAEHPRPPFPLDALTPKWLRDFVVAVATFTQTPPDLGALRALAVVGAAKARLVAVEAYEG
jgi:hypothetical protein